VKLPSFWKAMPVVPMVIHAPGCAFFWVSFDFQWDRSMSRVAVVWEFVGYISQCVLAPVLMEQRALMA
jgi:hypothetical protein